MPFFENIYYPLSFLIMTHTTKNKQLTIVFLFVLLLLFGACQKEDLNPPDNISTTCVDMDIRVYLEGAYDHTSGEMTTDLHLRGLLPGEKPNGLANSSTPEGQPYSTTPWNYNGTEGKGWSNNNYTEYVTDWVLVSFRTNKAKNTEIAQAAALLNNDGKLFFIDNCLLSTGTLKEVYIVIEHRNHMGIMSPKPIQINNGKLTYDFTAENSYTNGGFGQKELTQGVWSMYAGDTDQSDYPSYDINGNDNTWSAYNGMFNVYLVADLNLDGQVNGSDKQFWIANNGISSRVPK